MSSNHEREYVLGTLFVTCFVYMYACSLRFYDGMCNIQSAETKVYNLAMESLDDTWAMAEQVAEECRRGDLILRK